MKSLQEITNSLEEEEKELTKSILKFFKTGLKVIMGGSGYTIEEVYEGLSKEKSVDKGKVKYLVYYLASNQFLKEKRQNRFVLYQHHNKYPPN